MVFNSKRLVNLLISLFFPCLLGGCLSYQVLKEIDGSQVLLPNAPLTVGETSLADVLNHCGAPQKVISLDRQVALIYQRTVSHLRKFSLGIPIPMFNAMQGYDISANGGVSNSDTLVLVFTAQGILDHYTYEQGSKNPFLKTLFDD